MKTISKIAILAGFVVCMSSCEKENLFPHSCPVEKDAQGAAIQRGADPSDTLNLLVPIIKSDEDLRGEEIVGGGDDDRDGGGGGSGKKIKK